MGRVQSPGGECRHPRAYVVMQDVRAPFKVRRFEQVCRLCGARRNAGTRAWIGGGWVEVTVAGLPYESLAAARAASKRSDTRVLDRFGNEL